MSRLPRVAAVSGAALALAGSAFAAGQIATRAAQDPAAAAVTISSTAPLFNETGLVNGESFERCTVLTNQGPRPADVSLFGSSTQSALSPWLDLELVRGTLPSTTTPGDCAGFVPDTLDYGAGTPGVVYRGTLTDLPGETAGIADPTRWSVGEQHAYLLRVAYTGDNPQQGLTTVQRFAWGVTPFDDRPQVVPLDGDSTTPVQPDPAATTAVGSSTATGTGTAFAARQCTILTFPAGAYVGTHAITKTTLVAASKTGTPTKKKKKKQTTNATAASASGAAAVLEADGFGAAHTQEAARRQALLAATRKTARRTAPSLVVRLLPGKDKRLTIRVGLRKRGKITSPRRWRWVRVRLNATPTKSTLKWPFAASAQMNHLRLGYNQVDITLNRGRYGKRVNGLPKLLRRSFGFVVYEPTRKPGGSDCTLG